MFTWRTASVRSYITMHGHVGANMLRPCERFSAALMWTDPLPLASVPQHVTLQLTGRRERPAATELRAGIRTKPGVCALVLAQPTQLAELTTAAVKLASKRLAADVVLSCVRHEVTFERK